MCQSVGISRSIRLPCAPCPQSPLLHGVASATIYKILYERLYRPTVFAISATGSIHCVSIYLNGCVWPDRPPRGVDCIMCLVSCRLVMVSVCRWHSLTHSRRAHAPDVTSPRLRRTQTHVYRIYTFITQLRLVRPYTRSLPPQLCIGPATY